MEQQVLAWINDYGYLAIFALLMFGIAGLPIPDETLLTFTGYLVFRGDLHLAPAYLAGIAGSFCGITLSYILGRTFGLKLIHRYGRYLHITENQLSRAHAWFERVGHWSLTFGYFVPGVRHLTAYAAGMSNLETRHFVLFAYSGGCLWVASFMGLGYFLGDRWHSVEQNIHQYLLWATVAGAIILAVFLIWRKLAKAR